MSIFRFLDAVVFEPGEQDAAVNGLSAETTIQVRQAGAEWLFWSARILAALNP